MRTGNSESVDPGSALMRSRRPDLAIVRPPVEMTHKFSKGVESLALAYVAGGARVDGREVVMIDSQLFGWDPAETARRILDVNPTVAGFTVTVNYFPPEVAETLRLLREGGFDGVTLIGGHATSFIPDRIVAEVPDVDGVVSGEGEQAIRGILAAIADGGDWRLVPGVTSRVDGEIVRRVPERIHDLDTLPRAARDLLPDCIRLDAIPALSSSRGCYARCSFCSVPRFYGLNKGKSLASGAWLARSAEDTVAEIEMLRDTYGLQELLIVDDEFFGGSDAGHARALRIGQLLAERELGVRFAISCRAENVDEKVMTALRAGGLTHVFIGVESGSPADLRFYAKGHTVEQNAHAVRTVKSLGLTVQCGFMMFTPESTLRQLRENITFLRDIDECKPVTLNSTVDPHFGAPLARRMDRAGVLDDRGLMMSSSLPDPAVATAKEVTQRVVDAYIEDMNFLAAVRSSITWEWRRPVPGRSEENERMLDTYERSVHDGFAAIVSDGIYALADGTPRDEVLAGTDTAIAALQPRLRMGRALVANRLETTEGQVRYWSHNDLLMAGAAR